MTEKETNQTSPPSRLATLEERWTPLADRLLEYAYLLLLAFYTLAAFRNTTMLDGSRLVFTWEMAAALRILSLLLVGARLARAKSWRWGEIILAALICGALLRSWQHVNRSFIFELAVLIAGARGIDFTKILRVHFYAVAAALIVTVALALGGYIENLVYYRDGVSRMAFGIIYPTDFAAQVFFLTACWVWLRQRKITWWELGIIAALAVFCYVFCDARNSVACMLLLVLGSVYLKLRRRGAAKRCRDYALHPAAGWICVLSAPILAAVMILLCRFYSGEGWMLRLDGILSNRLYYGWTAFRDYSVNLFGQDVYMDGLGGLEDISVFQHYYYFFLDSSYVNMLFCHGIVTLTALLAGCAVSALREKRNRAWEHLLVLTVVALQCAFEHHFIELVYNPFLLLTLAVSAAASPAAPQEEEI